MNALDVFIALLEIILLITSFLITTGSAVKGVIRAYQLQSFLLALITGITALKRLLEGGQEFLPVVWLIMLIIFLPLALGATIEMLLTRATILVPGMRFRLDKMQRHSSERVWLRQYSKSSPAAVVFFIGLITLAAWVAFLAIPAESEFDLLEQFGLMISLALHLVGLYNTATKEDTISQVIGLLTMDHGLYLAVVKIVAIPVPATFFVFALYFYTFITIAIVAFIVPRVRHESESIDLDEIAESSELEG
jgi:hydrogenase-4 membrane subunit HyfE